MAYRIYSRLPSGFPSDIWACCAIGRVFNLCSMGKATIHADLTLVAVMSLLAITVVFVVMGVSGSIVMVYMKGCLGHQVMYGGIWLFLLVMAHLPVPSHMTTWFINVLCIHAEGSGTWGLDLSYIQTFHLKIFNSMGKTLTSNCAAGSGVLTLENC